MLVTVPSKLIRLQGSIKGKPEVLLIDSGASHNFISLRVCRKLALDVVKSPSINVKLADSSVIQTCGQVQVEVLFGEQVKVQLTFEVLDCEIDGVLGMPFLSQNNPHIDWSNGTVWLNGQLLPLAI